MEYFRKFKSYVLGEVSARSPWTVLVIGHGSLEQGVIVEQDLNYFIPCPQDLSTARTSTSGFPEATSSPGASAQESAATRQTARQQPVLQNAGLGSQGGVQVCMQP